MIDIVSFVLGWFFCFLLGSLPFSYWVVKIFKGIDLRKMGSGNVGATNVFRTQGKGLGSLALGLDVVKGVVAVAVIAPFFGENQEILTIFTYSMVGGVCAIAGHIWTPFLNWKGGKGVATSGGVFLGLLPLPFIISIAVFLPVFFFTGIISISSLAAALTMPIAVLLTFQDPDSRLIAVLLTLCLTIFIFYTHRANIGRLMRGEEKRMWNHK
jgi:glycerol-3-phosphate acyltransferase PlsY